MNADIFNLSYLLRYALAVMAVLIVWLLARQSINSLRSDLVYRVKPIPGFWLVYHASKRKDDDSSSFKLPLYHTTCIGKSASCDIRIRRASLGARHVMIYYYDRTWFIKPVSRRCPVYLNSVRIKPATPLISGDYIRIGDLEMTFTDAADDNISQIFTPINDDIAQVNAESYELRSDEPVRGTAVVWLLINLYLLIGSWITISLIPAGMTDLTMLLSGAILAVVLTINIYYIVLPIILRGMDRLLIVIMLFLLAAGMFVQIRLSGILSNDVIVAAAAASADPDVAQELVEFSGRIVSGLKSQGLSILLGLIIFPFSVILIARTRILEPLAVLCALLTPVLLAVTLIFGRGSEQYGATLWISIGGMSLQLTEFAKLTYIVVLASFFKVRPSKKIQLIFAAWAAIVFLLIMLLPDLGMVMILLPVTLVVYVVMTSEYLTTLIIMISGLAVSVFAYSFFPHVQSRLAGWSTLWQEVNDSNRQIVYGLQAVARGGLLGRGIGNGSPGGIPLVSSDMVFAIICEELGMLGALTIMILFVVIWLRSSRVTIIAGDGFTSSLALGAGTMLFAEAVVVMAGVAGLIPLTGVTLPFISAGGSSLLAKIILMSMLLGLSARRTAVAK